MAQQPELRISKSLFYLFNMMTITDIKIYTINAVAMALNFTNIDLGLKIILTIVAIGYTLNKWWYMVQEKRNKK